MYKKLSISLSLVAFLALLISGCTSWERSAFQTLSATQATLNQAQTDYEAGTIKKTQAAFTAITAAKTAQTAAVNQMVSYENLKASGATSSSLATAEAQVVTALNQLPAVISAVKALYTEAK